MKIKSRKLSVVLADFQLCKACHIVDRNQDRCREGFECPVCGAPSEGGLWYFKLNAHSLINLMQEAYHTSSSIDVHSSPSSTESNSHNISVVLFFCTLRELLLNNLIRELGYALKIPNLVYKRLLSDNKSFQQLQENLLPSLIGGVKWKKALEQLNKNTELDYLELDRFLTKVVDMRNRFMHEGKTWEINRELGESCLKNIWPLLNLYVDLHNIFVHPNYVSKADMKQEE